jgi:hypothetical protein
MRVLNVGVDVDLYCPRDDSSERLCWLSCWKQLSRGKILFKGIELFITSIGLRLERENNYNLTV